MAFDWVTFAFQLVNLLVLLAILKHFLFRPVADIIARRQAETDTALARAELARSEAEAAAAKAKVEAEANATARRDELGRAQIEAGAERARLIELAQVEARKLVEEAEADARDIVAQSGAQTLARARDLAGTIAAYALSAQPRPPTPAAYAARLADAVSALSDEERRGLFGIDAVTLVAAQPLTEAELSAVRAVLTAVPALERLSPEVAVDPALIAGLDIRASAGVIHNSLAHDLTLIAEALDDGDGSGV